LNSIRVPLDVNAVIPYSSLSSATLLENVALSAPTAMIPESLKPRIVKPVTVTSFTGRFTSPVSKLTSPSTQMPFTSAGLVGSRHAFCVGVAAGSRTAPRPRGVSGRLSPRRSRGGRP
jgi:hypothetical protein